MSCTYTEHIENAVNQSLHTFFVGYDLDNNGKISQVKTKFYEELFNDIPSFAFGSKNVMSRIKEPQDIAKVNREALRKLYNIKEIQEAQAEYLNSDTVEDKYINRGEFGELLLYHLLHEYFCADALISKIYFKDSAGLPAHGFDAVHVTEDSQTLWLGESKLYQNSNSAIDALAKDVFEHFNTDFFNSEFQIISNRVHDTNAEVSDFMKELISPDSKVLDKLANINLALFAGYNSQAILKHGTAEFDEELRDEVEKLWTREMEKLKPHKWNDCLNIYLFLFPLNDKRQFVKDLHLKLKGAQQG